MAQCCLCHANDWRPIPDPVPDRSITTAGVLLNKPLAKSQCWNCGLLQRTNASFVGDSDYYENRYADYYRRPGAEVYDAPRYAAMAEWMCAGIGDFVPSSILDAGCGAGWSMIATQKKFPNAAITGVEPSKINAERAREAGFEVRLGKFDVEGRQQAAYDLVYANNVMQHILSPIEFLTALQEHVSDSGLVVLICPDASRPSNEMLWCDHNYSYTRQHLARFAELAGFAVRSWLPSPGHVQLLDKQLIVLAKQSGRSAPPNPADVPSRPAQRLYQERCDYIRGWQEVHRALGEQVQGFSNTFNFGSSSWTWLLAGYCPEYWLRVDCCVVDQFGGNCLDKMVKPLSELPVNSGDGLVLGVNPVSQAAFAKRFQNEGRKIVRWDSYVQR
jgi:2-polyprenyl-3-methyl-5-hydroxy-6-metoxy-1,4-benzoquinol methylase